MSEARPGTSTPTVLRVIRGRRLQDIRLDTCASLEDAAQALRVQTLTVRRPERGEVALRPLYADKLLETYGADRQVSDEFIEWPSRPTSPTGGPVTATSSRRHQSSSWPAGRQTHA